VSGEGGKGRGVREGGEGRGGCIALPRPVAVLQSRSPPAAAGVTCAGSRHERVRETEFPEIRSPSFSSSRHGRVQGRRALPWPAAPAPLRVTAQR